ncbi:MAG: hypothetical protein PHS19_04490, partial [Eubacteriales bacterium]|nr:hypothetical protein [Eubacteriales bacterium]
AARPEAIIDAVVKGLGVLQAKREAMVNAIDTKVEEIPEAKQEEVSATSAVKYPPIFTMAEIKVNADLYKK